MFFRKITCLVAFFIIFNACKTSPDKTTYTDVAKEAGIDFKYTIGDFSYVNILESSGSGITVLDYNNDGLMDLYFLNGTWLKGISDDSGKVFRNSKDKLYRNNGNGTFTDVTEASGLISDTCWSEAAAAFDYDNDNDQDVYLLNYGANVFFRNNGNGTFTDITRSLDMAGPDTLNGFTKWSIGASWFDYNNDGRSDVMVGNFLAFDPKYDSPVTPGKMPHPSEYRGQASMLYVQQPDGSFGENTKGTGLYYPNSKCMGLTLYDFDDDADVDIFQANDHHFNYMFRNDGEKFTEVGMETGVAANSQGKGTGSMHGSPGDIDGDGLTDLLVTDLEYGALYRNIGKGIFKDVTEQSGVAGALAGKGGWGAVLFDYDNDGDPDIVSADGTAEELILQYPLLLENDGEGHFTDVGKERGQYFNEKRSGRGLVVLDYDNDGDMDVVISHIDRDGSPVLLRNDGGNRNHWLGITLKGKNPCDAVAAKVRVVTGEKSYVYVNQWATSYLSNNDPRLHIGLGNSTVIDTLEISWMGGSKDILENVEADRYLTIIKGEGIIK
jgi:hypothetical protein